LPIPYIVWTKTPLIVIARGSPAERAYISRLIIGRFAGSEIICENPLAVRIGGGYAAESVIDYVESLRTEFNISVEESGRFRCPEHAGSAPSSKDQKPHRYWLHKSAYFKTMFVAKSEILVRCMVLNPIARIASMAAPSLISTIGRFINDANMMLVGAAVSGGVFAIQSLGMRKISKKD